MNYTNGIVSNEWFNICHSYGIQLKHGPPYLSFYDNFNIYIYTYTYISLLS